MEDAYIITKCKVGEGTYGKVFVGKSKKDGQPVAVKVIPRENTDFQSLLQEITVLKNCHHENIIRFLDFFERNGSLYIITEYAFGGELFEHIAKRQYFSEGDARLFVRQILSALVYLHHNGVAHLDLKPENLLLKKVPFFYGAGMKGRFTPCIKLADFGTSTVLQKEQQQNNLVGTPGYVAPEVLRRENYSYEPDIYSLGVITYVLLSGGLPFPGRSVKHIIRAQLAGHWAFSERLDEVSAAARDFISQCLTYKPADRPHARDLLGHAWF